MHCEYFAKRLLSLFDFYNPDCFKSAKEAKTTALSEDQSKEIEQKQKVYLFANQSQSTWNSDMKNVLDEYAQQLDNMNAVL